MAALVEAERLTIGFGSHVLLREVSFAIEAGQVFVILGGSGCGKSTLLRHMLGLERPLGGDLRVLGRRDLAEGLARGGRPELGVLFQSGALLGSLTLFENVALPLRAHLRLPEGAVETVVRHKLALVGLSGFEHHLPAEISGGMKKRAGIARALALEPRLLLLDEPSAGLDPISAVELDELIVTLNRALGVTVVIVTHELESIFKVATTCIMLDRESKGIIARGDPRELRDSSSDPRVSGFFNRRSRRG